MPKVARHETLLRLAKDMVKTSPWSELWGVRMLRKEVSRSQVRNMPARRAFRSAIGPGASIREVMGEDGANG